MAYLTYQTSGPFATAARLLAQLACGYYFVVVASSGLNGAGSADTATDPAARAAQEQRHAVAVADLLLLWDLLRRLLDVLVADGMRRPVAEVAEKWAETRASLALHALSLVNLQVLDDATLDLLPTGVTMSVVRFLRFPELARHLVGVEDISMDVFKQVVMQFSGIVGLHLAEEHLLPLAPAALPAWAGARVVMCAVFGLVALRSLMRSRPVAKTPEQTAVVVEDEPATAEELDQICKV